MYQKYVSVAELLDAGIVTVWEILSAQLLYPHRYASYEPVCGFDESTSSYPPLELSTQGELPCSKPPFWIKLLDGGVVGVGVFVGVEVGVGVFVGVAVGVGVFVGVAVGFGVCVGVGVGVWPDELPASHSVPFGNRIESCPAGSFQPL